MRDVERNGGRRRVVGMEERDVGREEMEMLVVERPVEKEEE